MFATKKQQHSAKSKVMKKIQTLLTAALVSLAVSAAPGAGLLNGSFETPAISWLLQTYASTPAGFQWNLVPGGDFDLIRTYWQPSHGAQSLDMCGLLPGSIYQDFNFSSSGDWTIKFDMSANPNFLSLKTLRVDFGTAGGPLTTLGTFSLEVGTRTRANMQWVTMTTSAVSVVDSQLYRLQFTSLTLDDSGPALDNVRVEMVPEPSGFALLGCALAGLLCVRRSRRSS